MASGYLMTKRELPDTFAGIDGIDTQAATRDWQFLAVKDQLSAWRSQGDAGRWFIRLLEVACSALAKPFRLAPLRSIASWIVPLTVVAAIAVVIASWIDNSFPSFPELARSIWQSLYAVAVACLAAIEHLVRNRAAWIVGAAVIALAGWITALYVMRRKSLTQFTYGLLFAAIGWVSWIHLLTTDRLYLRLGRLKPRARR